MGEKEKDQQPRGYSRQPVPRRGNRRASGGSSLTGAEPRLAGLESNGQAAPEPEEEDQRAAWLKAERPPHY